MSKARDIVETLRTVLVDGDVTNANFTGADLDIAKGGTGASTAGAARTALGLAIGSDVQAFNAAIMVDGDIGTTVQAHDADTAKLDANANFTGTLQRGGTDVLVTGDVTNANFTGADLEIAKGGTGASSAGAARTALGLAIGTDVQAYDATILVDGDIGTTVLAPNGSAANLTNLPASGSADFVASGTLPNGKPVILNANGTVTVVDDTTTAVSTALPEANASFWRSAHTVSPSISFDPNTNGKFVICANTSNKASVIIGNVSGSTLSFGTLVQGSITSAWEAVAYDPFEANKFIITYQDQDGGQYNGISAQVCTVSGNSISIGAKVSVRSANASNIRICFDKVTSGKFIISFKNSSNNYATAVAGTRVGDNLSFGSELVINSGESLFPNLDCDPHNSGRFAVVYRDYPSSQYGTMVICNVSGSTITKGSELVYNSGATQDNHISFDPNVANKAVIAFTDVSNSRNGTCVVATLSGTGSGATASFSSEYVFDTGNTLSDAFFEIKFDKKTPNKFLLTYKDPNNSNKGTAVTGTISGTSISYTSKVVFFNAGIEEGSMAVNPNEYGRFVVVIRNDSNSYGEAIPLQIATSITTTNVTASNFLGTSTAAYTNGQTAKIMLQGGISTNQSSLAIGSTYYIQKDGTLATTADEPSVEAGKAVSATTLLLKGI